jgi:protein TIF31
VAHVRRLLDIVACTTAFAKQKHKPSPKHARPATPPSPPDAVAASSPAANGGKGCGGDAPAISEAHDMAAIGPPPKLGEFYDFFSFAHLTPPLHCKETHFSFSFSAVASRAECVWGIIN